MLILSGAGMLEVLFNATFVFKQAFTGVKVAVGNTFTFTTLVMASTQPLVVVTVRVTL